MSWLTGFAFISIALLQKEKLIKVRQNRNNQDVEEALGALTNCASTNEGNLLELSLKAARVRCTVGEISDALEAVHGRHVASSRMVSGAYLSEYGESDDLKATMEAVQVRIISLVETVVHMYASSSCCVVIVINIFHSNAVFQFHQ